MEYAQRLKYWLERNNWRDYARPKPPVQDVRDVIHHSELDEAVLDCGLTAYTDKQYNKVFAEVRKHPLANELKQFIPHLTLTASNTMEICLRAT